MYTLAAVRAHSSCGMRAPEHEGSVAGVRAQLPHCCGILVCQPGIKPESSALEGGFLTSGSSGTSQEGTLKFISFSHVDCAWGLCLIETVTKLSP